MNGTLVVLNTRFSAIHSWPNCDIEEVAYLRNPHRHEFHVTMKFKVTHDDRDIEFIRMKNRVDRVLRRNYHNKDLGAKSCETICKELMAEFGACFVRVTEDGENGAEITLGIYGSVG